MSNFTHTLMKNKKEIQIFDKICQNIYSFNHFIINQSGNPSTIKLSRNFNITAPIIYKDTVKEVEGL